MYQIFIYHLLGDYFSAKNLKDNQFLLEVLMIKEDWSPIGQEHFDLHLEFSWRELGKKVLLLNKLISLSFWNLLTIPAPNEPKKSLADLGNFNDPLPDMN